MKKISLENFGPIVSDKEVGLRIYQIIREEIQNGKQVEIDLKGIQSMATFCAKQIFGNLYIDLGPQSFFEQILLKNANVDVKTIIKIGIQNAIEYKDE